MVPWGPPLTCNCPPPLPPIGHSGIPVLPGHHVTTAVDGLQQALDAPAASSPATVSQAREDSVDSSTLLVGPDTPTADGPAALGTATPSDCASPSCLSTAV